MATELKFDLNYKSGAVETISLGDFDESSASVLNFKQQLITLNQGSVAFFQDTSYYDLVDPKNPVQYGNSSSSSSLAAYRLKETGAVTNAHIINRYVEQII